jgi:hypothetical protein
VISLRGLFNTLKVGVVLLLTWFVIVRGIL